MSLPSYYHRRWFHFYDPYLLVLIYWTLEIFYLSRSELLTNLHPPESQPHVQRGNYRLKGLYKEGGIHKSRRLLEESTLVVR